MKKFGSKFNNRGEIMKKILIVAILSVLSFAMDYKLKPIQISQNVWQFIGNNNVITKENGGNIANSYWIKTQKSWIIVDTGPTYDYAKQSHDQMKKISDLPIKMVINTHKHDDHWVGNVYFKSLGIKIYATKLQDEEDDSKETNRIFNILRQDDLHKTELVKIDEFITKNQKMNVDGLELDFIMLPYPGHTKEDIMIFMPSEKVLFSGDLLFSERITSIRDGSVEGSLKSLELIKSLNPKVFANGHGKFTDTTALNDMHKYLALLKESSLKAISAGIAIDDFAKTTDFKEFKSYPLYDIIHKENLYTAYKEYEFYE